MKIHLSSPFFFLNLTIRFLLAILFISFYLWPSFCEDALDEFKACGIAYNCGDLENISYPFWGNERHEYCGRQEFKLNCQDNKLTTIRINFQEYNVLNINQSNQTMTIARSDLFNDYCPKNPIQTATLDSHPFTYSSNARNISVWYNCTRHDQLLERYRFWCDSEGENGERGANYVFEEPIQTNLTAKIGECKLKIEVTVTEKSVELSRKNKTALLEKGLKQGFDVEYRNLNSTACEECQKTGGKCGSNDTHRFYCICRSQDAHPYICFTPPTEPVSVIRMLLAGLMLFGTPAGIIVLIFFIWFGIKRMLNNDEIEQIIRRFATQIPKRYSYLQVKRITKSFKNKLGQGGFSIVYKGKLSNGLDVAVKLLNESKGNGQDFINEVVSIAKTSHVNVVTLLGFCYERKKRALIYEYMPKGSLDKYISHSGLYNNDVRLDWTTLHNIVIGVARGLEYLHQGCNTRILHFDIKPHNILLDNDFCPKISDFGLAKQCEAKESHVTMTGVKGTTGFIAPEIIFKNFGRVSHKSDVYSYGMLILEMVGRRKNPNRDMSQSSEEYFPDWIYEDLTQSKLDGGSYLLNSEEEEEVVRKMIIIGLRCIQTLPDDRPSMSDVVVMLEGSVDGLQIPPKPTLIAPPELPQASSSTM